MKDLYNEAYLRVALAILADNLSDLKSWSVWNGEKKLDEIQQIQELLDLLTKQLLK